MKNKESKPESTISSDNIANAMLTAVQSDNLGFSGKNLLDDCKTASWNIDHVAGYGSRSLVRAVVIKQAMLVVLNYLKREYGETTYKRRAKAALNEAGFYHLSDLSRRLGVIKQTMDKRVKKLDAVYIIDLGGRKYYRWLHDK